MSALKIVSALIFVVVVIGFVFWIAGAAED